MTPQAPDVKTCIYSHDESDAPDVTALSYDRAKDLFTIETASGGSTTISGSSLSPMGVCMVAFDDGSDPYWQIESLGIDGVYWDILEESDALGRFAPDVVSDEQISTELDRISREYRGREIDWLASRGIRIIPHLQAMSPDVLAQLLPERIDSSAVAKVAMDQKSFDAMRDREDDAHFELCACCAGRPGQDDLTDRMRMAVALSSHAVVTVVVDTDQGGVMVAHTVGLEDTGWPEIALAGRVDEPAFALDRLVGALRRAERVPTAGTSAASVLPGGLKLEWMDEDDIEEFAPFSYAQGVRRMLMATPLAA